MSRSQLLIDNEGDGNLAKRLLTRTSNKVMQSSPKMESLVGPQFDAPVLPGSSPGRIDKPRITPAASNSSSIRAFSNPLDTLTQREGSGAKQSMFPKRPEEKSDIDKLISLLLDQSKSGYEFKRGGEEEQMINEIFGSQLAQIANARNSANTRFNESKTNTQNLYGGHVDEIRGADRQRYEAINQQNANATNANYDTAINSSVERNKAIRSEDEEMLTRLGLQDAAPQLIDANNDRQKQIDNLSAERTDVTNRNNEYATANIVRNDARAQSIADESITQQTNLERQLSSILGDLGNKEAELSSQKAQALFELMQGGKQEWRQDRDFAMSSLAELMEAQGSAESAGGVNGPVINNVLNGLGITDPRLQQQYSSAYTDAVLNAPYQPGLEDQEQSYVRYLAKQFPNLDKIALQQLVSGNLNYGTHKMGAPTS